MQTTCEGIILSGGLNRRMQGRNKALLELDGRSFLERIVTTLTGCFEQLLLVTKKPEFYKSSSFRTVKDIINVQSPLAGVHAGLVNIDADYGFCTSCDTPLLRTDLIRILINEIDPDFDIIVPSSGSYFQPLCAVYSKQCIPIIEKFLKDDEVKTDGIFKMLRVKTIDYRQLQMVDPLLESFFNVNTPEDFKNIRQTIKSLT
jgi:molybdopterin-guanine dinucleotide biosynthesis protein A